MANSLGINGFGPIEFYVGSAKHVAYWYQKALGFDCIGYKGPENGSYDCVSYFLKNHQVYFIITSALKPNAYGIQSFIQRHGDGVKRIYYNVDDVEKIYSHATQNGAIIAFKPMELKDTYGSIHQAAIKIYDDTEIVFLNARSYKGIFQPGFSAFQSNQNIQRSPVSLRCVDHSVGNVRINEMNHWANYFVKTMDFEVFVDFGPGDIGTQYSALLSKVVRTSNFNIRNPINEPYPGLRKSQIEEFLDVYQGSGVQHIAISCDNLIETIRALRQNGVDFLSIPKTYYDDLRSKNTNIKENINDLESLGILCDTQDISGKGYLLQLFTKPIGDRPSFFFEFIQRCDGSQGFGKGNFQALFESIERDQAKRGNL